MATNLRQKIFHDIAPFLPGVTLENLSAEQDLIGLGLDSLAMMKLATIWRRHGYPVSFARLIAAPRLHQWETLLASPVQASASPQIVARQEEDDAPFDLALMQHAYWVGREDGQHIGGIAAHFYHEFDTQNVDPQRLENAVNALFCRHGMLRVRILEEGQQQILAHAPWPGLTQYDLRDNDAVTAASRLEAIRAALSHRQMNIMQGEVFDVRLSHLPVAAGGGCRLHFNLDMIAADAMSLRVLLDDLATLYLEDSQPLPPLGVSFKAYQQQLLQPDASRQEKYAEDRLWWQQRVDDLPGAPVLPATRSSAQSEKTVVRRHHWLDVSGRQQLESRARQHQLTLPMLVATAFAEVLSQFSDEEDFILNLPMFNREMLHADVPHLVGDFTSSVLLAWYGTTPGTFLERAKRLQQQLHENVAHARFSGVEVLREASRRRGQQQFAPVVFTSALGLGELFSERVQQAFGSPGWIISQGPQVWLDAQITELNNGLLINWDAREASFPAGMLDLMFERFTGLLRSLVEQDALWHQAVTAPLPVAQQQVRQWVNATTAALPVGRLHDAFFALAAQQPHAPAIFWQQQEVMSYAELALRARRLAAYLIQQGVKANEPVAIALPKGPEQIVAVLGILACGAAWLPLNHQQPARRIETILNAAGVRHVIDHIPPQADLPAPAEVLSGDNLNLAYVIYTSGSTGEPKGVEISHLAAKNTLDDLNRRYPLGSTMRTLAVSALSFDLAVYDIFAPLSVGGAVVCIEDDSWRDAERWVSLIQWHQVSVLNCVPAIAEMALTSAAAAGIRLPLKLMLLGGDWVPLNLAEKLRPVAPGCRCVALGGTTETAIHSTVQEITHIPPDWRSVPYGSPLDNVQCRVVDSLGRDRCDWVSGELWIGGTGVAQGYRHDAARSADRFITVDGQRWYRTGDLARYQSDGMLEFLGRRDHQVKIRGYRIELGEIESALISHPAVTRGIALLGEQRQLVAAYTLNDSSVEPQSVRQHLQQRLPQEMVPEQLVALPALPLSSNGKIDRPALRQLLSVQPAEDKAAEAAHSGIEQRVARIWQQALQRLPAREDDFFKLGGDSLLATRVIAQLRREGFAGVTLSQLFASPQLARFCQALEAPQQTARAVSLATDTAGRYQPFPLTEVQQAYLFGRQSGFTLGGIGCTFYREFVVQDLDVAQLETALNQLIVRHDMLRAVFRDGQQQVLETVPGYPLVVAEESVSQQRDRVSTHTFDPAQWPLFTLSVVYRERQSHVAIAIDNLILDALSILQFYQELDALYHQRPLPAATSIQFRDALLAGQPKADAIRRGWEWWQPRLAEMPLAPQLPLACDPATLDLPRFTRRESLVAAADWQRLTQRARQAGVTPSAVMLNAFAAVLRRWSAQRDFTLNLTLFDRPDIHPDMPRVMGDFTSLVLVPCRESDDGWLSSVRQVQADIWGALDHRQLSAVSVLRELARRHNEPELVMPVVFTSALGLTAQQDGPQGMFSRPVWGISQTPQVWLDHQLTEHDGGVSLVWDAVDALFPAGLLDAMFLAYQQLVEHLCRNDWRAALPDLLPAPQSAVRQRITAAALQPRPAGTLHESVFRQAKQQGERLALIWQDDDQVHQLHYHPLATQALQLANWLIQQGVVPGARVAVHMMKGPQQVIAVLGILAAGATWVPVGIDQPPYRRDAIMQRADVQLVLDASTPLLGNNAVQAGLPALDAPVPVAPQALAYIIFTSGSTGEPKGVEMSHAAASNTLHDLHQRLNLVADDRVLALSALDFDLAVFDLFAPLACGAALVMVDEAHRRDAAHWLMLIRQHHVTVWNAVPALMEMLLAVADGQSCASLRAALVSGDWIGLTLPQRLAQVAPDCQFLALGGATEAAIWSNVYPVTQVDVAWRSIPYGYPLSNQCWRVVNSAGEDCPDWVDGELWIGGEGLARGYLGDSALTAARFPQHQGQRWYRTGDRGRYWPDGTLEFLGRLDTQMKLRGHRIEAGEVENALRQLPGVGQAVTSIWHDGVAARLIAAVVPASVVDDHPAITATVRNPQSLSVLEEEARLAETMLTELLRLPQNSESIWTPALMAVDRRGADVLKLWLHWLVKRQVLREVDGGFRGGLRRAEIDEQPSDSLLQQARTRYSAWRAMLRGEQSLEDLITDPLFAPASLSAADAFSQQWLQQLAVHITQHYAHDRKPLRITEINGAAGQHSKVLLDMLPPGCVDYTLMESTPLALSCAQTRFTDSAHSLTFSALNEWQMPEALFGSSDIVLAVNALHRFSVPAAGLMAARQLLKPGGALWMLERETLTPMAMITAGILAGGYGINGEHPLCAGAQWAQRARTSGFSDVQQRPAGLAASVIAHNPQRPIDLSAWSATLAKQLPKAMVPEKLVQLTSLPLSANGKVDRRLLLSLYDAMPQREVQQEALNACETALAAIWSQLLAMQASPGRRQGFFELGGDSLLATRLLNRIQDQFGVALPLRQVFSAPTLQEMADNISALQTIHDEMEGGAL